VTYGILANTSKPEVFPVLEKLIAAIGAAGAGYLLHDEVARHSSAAAGGPAFAGPGTPMGELLDRCGMVVALGGDGTMLSAARSIGARELPLLGINLGKLGFLAEVSVGDLESCLSDIAAGRYTVDERPVLEAYVGADRPPLTALNEIAIDRGASARVIDFETFVDGEYLVTYAADGIIVTTPTGSTGYSLATGGPIVTPGSGVLTIVAISPHTLTARPVIIPAGSEVRVHVREGPPAVHVTADGQVEKFSPTPVECTIRRAPFRARLVRWRRGSYFDLLRTKLMWGRDLRAGREDRR
jgi:NAD+ kinase